MAELGTIIRAVITAAGFEGALAVTHLYSKQHQRGKKATLITQNLTTLCEEEEFNSPMKDCCFNLSHFHHRANYGGFAQ